MKRKIHHGFMKPQRCNITILRMNTYIGKMLAGVLFLVIATPAATIDLPKVAPVNLEPLADLEGPAGSKEVSGIVASRQWPGVFWVHNDSGDEPRIYPVDRQGRMRKSARAADAPGVLIGSVINSDWEDIAVDASGHVIVADVGNNSNGRRDLALTTSSSPSRRPGSRRCS